MNPLILASSAFIQQGYNVPMAMIGTPYVQALEQFGATCLVVTAGHSPRAREHLLDLAHGFVLTGGEDISPHRYGEVPTAQLGTVSHIRDEMEFALLEGALQRGIPVLGICRGMQVLNVALGGTLYQDLPTQKGGPYPHMQMAPVGKRSHQAIVKQGCNLSRIFGRTDLFINSFHHQAIKDVAPGLQVIARADDGIIEAVEGTEHPWLLGVQWHPERGEAILENDKRDPDRRIFYAFDQACRAFMEGRLDTLEIR